MSNKELLICLIKDFHKVEALLTGFLELGITGATVVDGRGMGEIISTEIPVFAGLRSLFPRGNMQSYLVFSVLDVTLLKDTIALVEEICGDLSEPGTGIVFTIPVSNVFGMAKEI